MGFFGRTIAGGLAGGALGFANTGDLNGVAAGAAAGAGAGAFGGMLARGLSGGATVAGFGQRALGFGMRGANRVRQAAKARMGNLSAGGAAASYINDAMRSTGKGLFGARQWIGNNAVAVNKWGGRALMGLGVGSAAYIGSSVLSSNR